MSQPDSRPPQHERQPLETAYHRTRSGLISLLLRDHPLDDTEDAIRQQSLTSIVDQVFDRDWRGWSSALCREALAETPGVSGVGISLASDSLMVPIGASDRKWTPTVEEFYLTFGEGPAITVVSSGKAIMLDRLDFDETRWLGWSRAAGRHGVRGVWCYPLVVEDDPVAALSFYLSDDRPLAIDGGSEHVRALVDLAVPLVQADLGRILTEQDGLAAADIVHVAAGMLSIQLEIGTDEAIARLRGRAFVSGTSLIDTAAAMVEQRPRFVG